MPQVRAYTGVGSRSTPIHILDLMTRIARVMGVRDWVLRSGAAEGADSAFEAGARDVGGPVEIFVPWVGFQRHASTLTPSPEAFELAATVHPAWKKLPESVRKLHARNTHQVLGKDLKSPSDLLICWTLGGKEVGGTATAIRLALKHKIPVWNLGLEAVRSRLVNWVAERETSSPRIH